MIMITRALKFLKFENDVFHFLLTFENENRNKKTGKKIIERRGKKKNRKSNNRKRLNTNNDNNNNKNQFSTIKFKVKKRKKLGNRKLIFFFTRDTNARILILNFSRQNRRRRHFKVFYI